MMKSGHLCSVILAALCILSVASWSLLNRQEQEPQQRRYREKKAEADSETDEDWEKRVVNGIDPYWGERFSFYVRVQSLVGVGHNQWASVFCGGSVVAARYVLTHEKCIKGVNWMRNPEAVHVISGDFVNSSAIREKYKKNETKKHYGTDEVVASSFHHIGNNLLLIKLSRKLNNTNWIARCNTSDTSRLLSFIIGTGSRHPTSIQIPGDLTFIYGRQKKQDCAPGSICITEMPPKVVGLTGEHPVGIRNDTPTLCMGDAGSALFDPKVACMYGVASSSGVRQGENGITEHCTGDNVFAHVTPSHEAAIQKIIDAGY